MTDFTEVLRCRIGDALAIAPPESWTVQDHAEIMCVLEAVAERHAPVAPVLSIVR